MRVAGSDPGSAARIALPIATVCPSEFVTFSQYARLPPERTVRAARAMQAACNMLTASLQ